jgi:hypothetical protein
MTNSNSRKSRQRNLNLTTDKKTNPVAVQNAREKKFKVQSGMQGVKGMLR